MFVYVALVVLLAACVALQLEVQQLAVSNQEMVEAWLQANTDLVRVDSPPQHQRRLLDSASVVGVTGCSTLCTFIKGGQGPQGFNGTQGPNGAQGQIGPQGVQGPIGQLNATNVTLSVSHIQPTSPSGVITKVSTDVASCVFTSSGKDTAGVIVVTATSNPATNSIQNVCTIKFAVAFTATPVVLLSPAYDITNFGQGFPVSAIPSPTGWTFRMAVGANGVYTWNYMVIGT